jgi:hypothetical protein
LETTFSPGFSPSSASDVHVGYFNADGLLIPLTFGGHFSAALGAAGAVTAPRIAFPPASSDAPITIAI